MVRSSVEQLITPPRRKGWAKALVGRVVAVEVAAVIGVMKYMICLQLGATAERQGAFLPP